MSENNRQSIRWMNIELEKIGKKFCSKCETIKSVDDFLGREKRSQCKKCRALLSRKWEAEHPEKKAEQNRLGMKRYYKKQKEQLGDHYIVSILTSDTILKRKDIPNNLIEIKRLHLQLKKELSNADKITR